MCIEDVTYSTGILLLFQSGYWCNPSEAISRPSPPPPGLVACSLQPRNVIHIVCDLKLSHPVLGSRKRTYGWAHPVSITWAFDFADTIRHKNRMYNFTKLSPHMKWKLLSIQWVEDLLEKWNSRHSFKGLSMWEMLPEITRWKKETTRAEIRGTYSVFPSRNSWSDICPVPPLDSRTFLSMDRTIVLQLLVMVGHFKDSSKVSE